MDKITTIKLYADLDMSGAVVVLTDIIKNVAYDDTREAKEVALEIMNVGLATLEELKSIWLDGGPLYLSFLYASGASVETACWLNSTKALSDFKTFYTDMPESKGERYNLSFTLGVEDLIWQN